MNSRDARDPAELKRLYQEQAAWGFISRYGRTGRIDSLQLEDGTIHINTPKGFLRANVGADTVIERNIANEIQLLTLDDLTLGTLITVTESGDIQVVPEGEGGFNLTPAAGAGPRSIPVFP